MRLECEGALYHVTSSGNRREPIFEADADREAWLEVLGHALARFDATAFAYCLMGIVQGKPALHQDQNEAIGQKARPPKYIAKLKAKLGEPAAT